MLPECRKYYSILVCVFSSLSAPHKGNAMTAYSVEDRTPGHVSLVGYMLLILIFSVMLVIRSILYVGRAFALFICKKRLRQVRAKGSNGRSLPGFLSMKYA